MPDALATAACTRAARLDDRGEVAANTVAFVVILALFFFVVEVGAILTAQQTARSAAGQALDVARLEGRTAAEGEHVAEQFLDRTRTLQRANVTVTRTTETVTVTVTGQAGAPHPIAVSVTLTAPVERIVA